MQRVNKGSKSEWESRVYLPGIWISLYLTDTVCTPSSLGTKCTAYRPSSTSWISASSCTPAGEATDAIKSKVVMPENGRKLLPISYTRLVGRSREHTWHFEGQFALATDFSDWYRLSMFLDLLSLPVATFTGDFNSERRSFDMMIGEFQVNDVVSGFGWFIWNFQCTVLVIFALDFGLTGALDGKR